MCRGGLCPLRQFGCEEFDRKEVVRAADAKGRGCQPAAELISCIRALPMMRFAPAARAVRISVVVARVGAAGSAWWAAAICAGPAAPG